jgi:hypothetical protein
MFVVELIANLINPPKLLIHSFKMNIALFNLHYILLGIILIKANK